MSSETQNNQSINRIHITGSEKPLHYGIPKDTTARLAPTEKSLGERGREIVEALETGTILRKEVLAELLRTQMNWMGLAVVRVETNVSRGISTFPAYAVGSKTRGPMEAKTYATVENLLGDIAISVVGAYPSRANLIVREKWLPDHIERVIAEQISLAEHATHYKHLIINEAWWRAEGANENERYKNFKKLLVEWFFSTDEEPVHLDDELIEALEIYESPLGLIVIGEESANLKLTDPKLRDISHGPAFHLTATVNFRNADFDYGITIMPRLILEGHPEDSIYVNQSSFNHEFIHDFNRFVRGLDEKMKAATISSRVPKHERHPLQDRDSQIMLKEEIMVYWETSDILPQDLLAKLTRPTGPYNFEGILDDATRAEQYIEFIKDAVDHLEALTNLYRSRGFYEHNARSYAVGILMTFPIERWEGAVGLVKRYSSLKPTS